MSSSIRTPAPAGAGGGEGGGSGTDWVPLVIFLGESNSGGYAENADASAGELAVQPQVQIFDNDGPDQWLDLDIGTNNLVGHAGLSNGSEHGWELGLANSVTAGDWDADVVYLVKCGQGGSKLELWAVNEPYWITAYERIAAAIELLIDAGKTPAIYVWYTHGINDAIAGTNEATWIGLVEELHERLRALCGTVPIFFSKIMAGSSGEAYNDTIDTYCDEVLTYAIDVTGATTRDANHWDYDGMKQIAGDLVAASVAFGEGDSYAAAVVQAQQVQGLAAPHPTEQHVGPLTWGQLTNTVDNGDGDVGNSSNSTPIGAVAIETLDIESDWYIETVHTDSGTSQGVVVMVHSNSDDDYAWGSTVGDFVIGNYHFGDAAQAPTSDSEPNATGFTETSYPVTVKMQKNGTSVDFYYDTGAGYAGSPDYTATGVLAGLTGTHYIKAVFAVPATGQHVTVSIGLQ